VEREERCVLRRWEGKGVKKGRAGCTHKGKKGRGLKERDI
jgi:hypothetical protein